MCKEITILRQLIYLLWVKDTIRRGMQTPLSIKHLSNSTNYMNEPNFKAKQGSQMALCRADKIGHLISCQML